MMLLILYNVRRLLFGEFLDMQYMDYILFERDLTTCMMKRKLLSHDDGPMIRFSVCGKMTYRCF